MSAPKGLDYRWLRWRAMTLLVFARNNAAEDVFDTMLARWPDDAYALASRAHLRAQAGRRSQAIADMQRVVELPDATPAHWYNLGFLLDEAERYADAEPAFRRAIELKPDLDQAWYGLGLVLIRLQRLDEAVAALERNTKLQPMSPYAWYQLARVQVDRAKPDEARKIIRHLKGFEPKVAAQLERETGLTP
jgi:tetratricopeptide (TPR) repeat protein